MKPIDPKDRPKLFALIAIALLIFGLSAFQFVSYNSAQAQMIAGLKEGNTKKAAMATAAASGGVSSLPSPGGGAAASTHGAGPAPAALASGAPTDAAAALAAAAAAAPPTGGKDPFVPVGRFSVAAVTPKATPAPALVVPPASPLPKPGSPVFDASPVFTETTPRSPSGIAPLLLPPPPPPAYTVTGVVIADRDVPGSKSVAVLRADSGSAGNGPRAVDFGTATTTTAAETFPDRRFVTVGDPVGNGFVVASVRSDGVDLRNGKRLVTLKIGNVK